MMTNPYFLNIQSNPPLIWFYHLNDLEFHCSSFIHLLMDLPIKNRENKVILEVQRMSRTMCQLRGIMA